MEAARIGGVTLQIVRDLGVELERRWSGGSRSTGRLRDSRRVSTMRTEPPLPRSSRAA